MYKSPRSKKEYGFNGNWYIGNNREPGIIYGFLRLRLSEDSGNEYFPELKKSALVRELHVYGPVASKNNKNKQYNKAQHKGFGKILMKKAEEISMKNGYKKISVISGIGVRNYYKKIGYRLINTYMIKELKYNYDVYVLITIAILSYIIRLYLTQ